MAQKKSATEKAGAGANAFTCKECGSHEIAVEHFFTAYAGPNWTDFLEKGDLILDPGHESAHTVEEWSEAEEVESGTDSDEDDPENGELNGEERGKGDQDKGGKDEETDEKEDGGDAEEDRESEDDEESDDGLEVDDDSHSYFVRCKGCNREIEFGWTQPGGEDKIWPTECSDFDPAKCWPDPRYQDAWVKKGWIQGK